MHVGIYALCTFHVTDVTMCFLDSSLMYRPQ
jgi:hypothetical protein